MLTKNPTNFNKTEKYVKRRYSQAIENDNQNEPTKKLRKIKNGKSENLDDSTSLTFDENGVKLHSEEFQDFLKHFMIPSNIYKNLAIRHKSNPILLKRNLSYLFNYKPESQRLDLQTIADHLSTVRFHDENLALMKGKYHNKLSFPNYPNKVVFKFEQFMDSKTEKDWKTIDAVIYLDIIHFYRDNRKNKCGFVVKRVISAQKIKCNDDMKLEPSTHTVDIRDVMKSGKCYRVHKSVFHFKILAKEKKTSGKSNLFDKKSEDKNNDIFPVTYEAMMPLFNNLSNRNVRSLNYCVQSGKYEIYTDVTDMEKCDDSLYSGKSVNVYDDESKSVNQFDCQWYKTDDPEHKTVNKNKAKIIFQIENEEIVREKQKPMQTRNKSLPPIIKMSPIKTGELRLSSITLNEKPKVEVNIAYKFVVKDKIVQWTQTRHLTCPWCHLNFYMKADLFDAFKQLLDHLNNWHSKLTFSCKKLKNRTALTQALATNFLTIEVKLADNCDYDWDFGHVLLDQLPARRMPVGELIYSKQMKPVKKVRNKNHERDYSHSWSAVDLKEAEFEIDSESEENLQWLFNQYYRKVEEFSDLNHNEKRVIQMWNRDLLSYGVYLCDSHLKPFVENFVQGIINDETQLKEVKSMRNTFMLHLVNLIDFGVLSSSVMLQCMKKLDDAFEKI